VAKNKRKYRSDDQQTNIVAAVKGNIPLKAVGFYLFIYFISFFCERKD